MNDVFFSIHLPEELHGRLVAVKQQKAPNDSWAEFIGDMCSLVEGDPAFKVHAKAAAHRKENPILRPWQMAPVKASPLFAEAIKTVKELEAGQLFTLWDFFGDRWDEVPSPRVFGRLFKQEVEKQKLARHVDDDKTHGVAVYERSKPPTPLFE